MFLAVFEEVSMGRSRIAHNRTILLDISNNLTTMC